MRDKILLNFLEKYTHQGLLVLRVGLGISFLFHGWPKLVGGPQRWTKVGSAVSAFGLESGHTALGLMAAVTEFGGGLLLIAGFLTRPVLIPLVMTMFVATVMHISKDHEFSKISHPLEVGLAFIGLLFVGPGKFSVDHWWASRK